MPCAGCKKVFVEAISSAKEVRPRGERGKAVGRIVTTKRWLDGLNASTAHAFLTGESTEMAMRTRRERKIPSATSERKDKAPPPFVEEVEKVDRARSSDDNSRIARDEAEWTEENAALVDRVHRLTR